MNDNAKLGLLNLLPGWVVRKLMRTRYERMIGGGGEVELSQLPRIVRKEDLALDVGSNLGIYTYALSQLAGQVIAFEPIPLLARFVRNQALPNVTVREIALSATGGERELCVPEEGAAYATLRDDAPSGNVERLKVATQTLDALGLGRIGFMKIDVEGFEEAVLNGAQETIKRDKPRLLIEIEERHNVGGIDRIVTMLAAMGYDCSFFHNGDWHSISDFELERDQNPKILNNPIDGRRYINNFLFLPNGEALKAA